MLKGKKAKGKKGALAPAVMNKQEAKKVVNPLRKGPRTSALGKISSPKEISYSLSNGPATSSCSGKEPSSVSGSKYSLLLISSPRPWSGKQPLTLLKLAHKYRPETK
jgi:large subunit ribosomal protein L7Ae